MPTSCTNLNFGFKPLLLLHLNYVNIKPKPCEIQNREHLVLVYDKPGLSFSCYTFWMGECRASLVFQVFCCHIYCYRVLCNLSHSCLQFSPVQLSLLSVINIHSVNWCQVTIKKVQNLLPWVFFARDLTTRRWLDTASNVPKAQPWK